jgi:hypothetical protein
VAVRSKLRNDAARGARLVLTTQLVDASGAVAAQVVTPVSLAAGKSAEIRQDLALADAHLWQGVKDPYLYRLKSVIKDARGQVVDNLDQGFGVRQIRIDPEKGLISTASRCACTAWATTRTAKARAGRSARPTPRRTWPSSGRWGPTRSA